MGAGAKLTKRRETLTPRVRDMLTNDYVTEDLHQHRYFCKAVMYIRKTAIREA